MSGQEVWQVLDEAAVIYERDFVPALFGQWAPLLADAAAIGAGDRVPDVGCGTGVVAREVAGRVGSSGHVVGLDLNEGMLAVAGRVRPEIEWRAGDAGNLPFEDGAFDAVVSQFVLMFCPDQVAALREMWRVLAPGGRLALAAWEPLERTPGYRDLARVAEERVSDEAAAMLGSLFSLGDDRELTRLFDAAGIPDPELQRREGRACFPSIEAMVRTEVKATPLNELLDEAGYEALLAGARSALEDFSDEGGKVAIPITARIVTARKA